MTKGSQIWDGDRKRAFFRAYIQRETSLDAAGAEKLAEALSKAVNMMRVWDLPEPATPAASDSSSSEPTPADKTALETTTPENKKARHKASPRDAAAPFDPYAFSLMVVLAKTGKDGLAKRLAEIKTAEHLRALAEAQHLAVNTALKKPEDLRKAIVAATAQRLADRKAAAS